MNFTVKKIPHPGKGRINPFSKCGELKQILLGLKADEAIVTEDGDGQIYRAAAQIGMRLTRRKLPTGGWAYWKR